MADCLISHIQVSYVNGKHLLLEVQLQRVVVTCRSFWIDREGRYLLHQLLYLIVDYLYLRLCIFFLHNLKF